MSSRPATFYLFTFFPRPSPTTRSRWSENYRATGGRVVVHGGQEKRFLRSKTVQRLLLPALVPPRSSSSIGNMMDECYKSTSRYKRREPCAAHRHVAGRRLDPLPLHAPVCAVLSPFPYPSRQPFFPPPPPRRVAYTSRSLIVVRQIY